MKNSIVLENVSFGYKKNQKILKDVNLEIKKGDFLGIAGLNGSGKTTFTLLLNSIIPKYIRGEFSGDVFIQNKNTKKHNIPFFAKKVGMLFQNPDFSLFNLSVKEEIEFGLKNFKFKNKMRKITRALNLVDMKKYLKTDPQTLSYGQKQKVNLACILALNTPFLVLDEPSAMLDYKSALELYKILKNLNKKGKTIIVVEHDTEFLSKFTKNIIILNNGKIAKMGKTKEILKKTSFLKRIGLKPLN